MSAVFSLLSCPSFAEVAEKENVLRVGVYENHPKIFLNEQQEADGFFIDLLKHLSAAEGYSLEFIPIEWEEGLEMLNRNELDILPDMTYTRERDQRYELNHITVLENWASLYIHKDDEPKYYTIQNIKDISIAALEGDSNLEGLKKQLGRDTLTINFKTFPSYHEVLRAVERQEVKLGLVNYYFGLMNEDGYEAQRLQMVINPTSVHFAAPKGMHTGLLQNFDRRLCQLKDNKNSVYYAYIENWLDPSDIFKFPRWLSLLLSVLVVLSLFSIITLIVTQNKLKESRENLRIINQELEQEIRKKAETEKALQLRNEELAATNSTLDEFVYRVSHNLRAPLTSILGLISVIRLELQQSADSIHTYIQQMESSIHKLDETIREIIDYSRNSRMEVLAEEVELEGLVHDIFQSMEHLNKDVRVSLRTDIEAETRLICDSRRLHSILQNLISNALKYYNPYADEHWVAVKARVKPEKVLIEVQDNGLGIPADQQQRIFNMFFRGSSQGSGAGLGLYIVQQTVERLEGQIRVSSESGKGSCFQVKIPNLQQQKTPDQQVRRFV